FDALPDDLRAIVLGACRIAGQDMLAEYTARNHEALEELVKHGVALRRFPDDVLKTLRRISTDVMAEVGSRDELSRRIHASYTAFQDRVRAYHAISEEAYYRAR